ncbi:MAG: ATP-binding cassette domain-containing protein [Thermoguttaceae bacterium]|nr:ATP-binding cassette domain-containing protein [Thermoguttaceae bacterium]
MPTAFLSIHGANANNLKNVSVEIPLNALTVITGLSGSGKSSLAFDTLYAQSQRQYMEGLSPTLRALFRRQPMPKVERIENLPPAVAVDQQPLRASTRSTVGTATEIYDFLRVLFAKAGRVACPNCGCVLQQQSQDSIVDRILELPEGTRLMILAPIVRKKKGRLDSVIEQVRKRGMTRIRIDGTVYELDDVPELDASSSHSADAVVDRCVSRPDARSRLADSVATAVNFSGSAVIVCAPDADGTWTDSLYSTLYSCPQCGENLPEVEPRTFSLYSPYFQTVSQCVTIFGKTILDWTALDVASLRPVVEQTQSEFSRLGGSANAIARPLLEQIARRLDFLDRAGVGYLSLDRTLDTLSGGEMQRVKLSRALGSALTGVCYILDEPSIGLHRDDCAELIKTIRDIQRLGNTIVAVEHDPQFIRAADYIIDIGPGAGDQGGTVLAAGSLSDVLNNPASVTGKWLLGNREWGIGNSNSPEANLKTTPYSLLPTPQTTAYCLLPTASLSLTGATLNNLQNVDLEIPLGKMTVVTGRSGSGKSSLIIGTLLPAVKWSLTNRKTPNPAEGLYKSLVGFESLERVVWIDQSPIGRSPRSNPATFSGVYDEIRRLFAQTKTAKRLGYSSARFSFNTKGGRCETCQGTGFERVELNFLPDMFIPCPDCGGKQFNPQTLSVKYKDKSIADVLAMSIEDAAEFFADIPKIAPALNVMNDLGLGYLRLGQGANTLSGGEAQRLKLSAELKKCAGDSFALGGSGAALYVLDEPTTGLHGLDVERLVDVLRRLTDAGNTVVVIEHNEQVQNAADRIVELGPGGGRLGGRIINVLDKE